MTVPLNPRLEKHLEWMETESRFAHACPDLDQEFSVTLKPQHESGSDTGWIQTFTGGKFWPLEPRAEDVRIEDVAHALAYQCRYAGHATRFYSVAEHCCLLADYVLRLGNGSGVQPSGWRQDARTALLHDAAEAYLPDLARPLKHRMPEWRAADAQLEAVVMPALGGEHPLPAWMKLLDARILRDERPAVMRETGESWQIEDLEPLGVWVRGIPPHEAERWFLDLYSELREK